MGLMAITPSEYYDQDHGGRIPVFKPTMAEFEDFYTFMEAIDGYGKEAGIVKVIPPKEWTQQLPPIDKKLELIRVHNPIVQHIMGSQGVYQQTNVEKRRPYTVDQWRLLCQEVDHKPPDLTTDRSTSCYLPTTKTQRRRRSMCTPQLPALNQTSRQLPSVKARSRSKRGQALNNQDHLQTPNLSKRTKLETQANDIDLARLDDPVSLNFDLHELCDERYTSDYCKNLERVYWRNLTFNQPLYGADMSGTLFDASVKSWNVNKLNNLLNQIGVPLPGVNTPYLYFGMWKATFPWHVEDMDLYSINYLHFGAPKQWYAIPGSYNKKFESVMQTTFFQQFKTCPEFMRHKTQIASPYYLVNNGIPVHRCVQYQGEFIITYPFGYHSGYNLDFNCAESVNFALPSWLEIGRRAKRCRCISDSVTIDMAVFDSLRPEKKQMKSQSPKIEKPCVLCNGPWNAELETCDGKMVHRLCAELIPDTHLDQSAHGTWIVQGIKDIAAARWKLTCLYCKGKKGACIQCCFGKCCRSFHPSCANHANATIIRSKTGYDAYCPLHDPKRQDEKRLEMQDYIRSMIQVLYPGKPVIAKWPGSGFYKGWVESHIVKRKSSRVKFEDGVSRIITWKDIRFDP